MIDIKPTVVKSVNEVITEKEACDIKLYWLAPKKDDTLPCIVYNEVENNDYARVHGVEYANITIQFTTYAVDPRDLFRMAEIVDEAMANRLGFDKSYSGPCVQGEGMVTQVIRFSGVVNHHKSIFKN